MVNTLTPEERRRRRAIRFANWLKRGFVPNEAAFFVGQGFEIGHATGQQKPYLSAVIARRKKTIARLQELNFTERDIFNYLTEGSVEREEGAEDLLFQFSDDAGFGTRADRSEFVNKIANRPAALLLEQASDTDWSRDRLESRNFAQWKRFRRVPDSVGSRFPNFRPNRSRR